jgi:hypothetical protein
MYSKWTDVWQDTLGNTPTSSWRPFEWCLKSVGNLFANSSRVMEGKIEKCLNMSGGLLVAIGCGKMKNPAWKNYQPIGTGRSAQKIVYNVSSYTRYLLSISSKLGGCSKLIKIQDETDTIMWKQSEFLLLVLQYPLFKTFLAKLRPVRRPLCKLYLGG